MSRVMAKNNMTVTQDTVKLAMAAFRRLVPAKTALDLNQFDIIMKSIGVKCPFDRHQLFKAFDFDGNNTVEYTEFIWGIAMLFDGSLAQQFDRLWKSIDSDNTGTLDKYEVFMP